jgi:hypothetical protein
MLFMMTLATLVDLLVARSSIARTPNPIEQLDADAEQARS